MTRLGLVPELKFAEDFKQLRRDIENIKAAQRVGRDILKPKIIECLDGGDPTEYDLVATYDAVDDDVHADFVVRFTADHQTQTWGVPLFKLMYGSPGTPATPGQASGFTYPYFADFEDEPGKVSYYGWFDGNFGDHTSIYIKVYFYATDTGTLTVTEESP